jgi:hypothetical protein
VQHADGLVLHDSDLGLAGRRARRIRRHQAEGVQTWIERFDPGQQRCGELDRRELLVTDQRGDLERRPPGQILVDQEFILRTKEIVSSGP